MISFIKKAQQQEYEALVAEHAPQKIAKRLAQGPAYNYLRDVIYGAIDGAITTFAIVAGVSGAGLSSGVVIVLGLANVVADGFSMGVSNYLGVKADNQLKEKVRLHEKREIALHPEGEREEVRQIFSAKGFHGEQLEQIVSTITNDETLWINTMLQDEYGLSLESAKPWLSGSFTFIAFIMLGVFPLMPFLVNFFIYDYFISPFYASIYITLLSFLLVGAAKATQVKKSIIMSALETALVGGVAASLAYYVGVLLKDIA